jgi:hypothetical protein
MNKREPMSNETKLKISKKLTGIHQKKTTIDKRRQALLNIYIDEKASNWKGDKVGYQALHTWVRKKLGKPSLCSYCNFTSDNNRQFHWANISHEYKRDLTDWIRLCVSCHRNYDYGNITIELDSSYE